MSLIESIPLHETARKRYLNYALSVITSRALPDIRDGLKPVQRRILYAMFANLRLNPDARFRKSATIVGECFVKGTLVATERGLVPIQDVQRGERVFTESGLKPVTELYEMPAKPLLEVTLENGLSNTVTHQQPFRVINADLSFFWKEAKDLEAGDWIVLKKDLPFPEDFFSLPSFGNRSLTLTTELAYLLGHLMADGWVTADYGIQKHLRLGFCSMDFAVIEHVRFCCKETFGYLPSLERNKEGLWVTRINNKKVNAYLADVFGLTADLEAHTKFIPDSVLQSPESVAWAFIAGLFDGDGALGSERTRARYVSTSTRLIEQLQVLLQHLGVPSKRALLHSNPTPCYVLTARGAAAQHVAAHAPFRRGTLRRRAVWLKKKDTYRSQFDCVPNGARQLFGELSAHHQGGGWYQDWEGNSFRQGVTNPDGTKIRYSSDLHEQRLSLKQIEDWGLLDKLERLGSPLHETLDYFRAHGLFFVRVAKVHDASPEKTYDLQVATDHHFVANGVVVHNCMGKYHPHGDTAIYDAMVRMAQAFSLRDPLVDGHGNFGSLDGDNPAAMRYTEAKLRALAMELLQEIRQQTVDFRPNFDGTLSEPVVLPARFPNLLVNGATGIAVGMATNIPPHNLGEVIDACVYMIDGRRRRAREVDDDDEAGWPNVRVQTLVEKFIQGPDFPTGARVLNTREELIDIYTNGEGPIELRGDYTMEGKTRIVITSVPYAVTKSDLVEKIAEHIARENIPQLSDVRDESTDDVRIVLELKRGSNPEAVMAYLFKHTSLQTRFHVNLTCLIPTDNPEVAAPQKVDLPTVLIHFCAFRLEVLVRRLTHELEHLEKRIHILKGFEKIFDALDEAIKIIRSSKDKSDASQRLRHRFRIDDVQAEAILETKLYKLSQLEIDAIRQELADKQARAAEIRALLADEDGLWKIVREELREVQKTYATDRRTLIAGPDEKFEYAEEVYIIDEDVYVIVTRDGWVKRQGSYTAIENIRIREGDEIGWVLPASTRETVAFLTNYGRAYTLRVDELPSTTGYGHPVQKQFDFSDKERVVGVISFDPRVLPKPQPDPEVEPELFKRNGEVKEDEALPYLVSVTRQGMALRTTIEGFTDPSTKNGRLFMRPAKKDEVIAAEVAGGDENVCMASKEGHVLIFPVHQIPVYKGAGKGVIAMRLDKDDHVLGATLSNAARDGLEVETSRGRREIVRTTKFDVSNRGNKGRLIIKRGHLAKAIISPIEIQLNGRE